LTVNPLEGTTDRRIDALLRLLADNPMIVISGAKVAREIGVSRHTVWRWVEKLRALGVKVKGQAGRGYRIEKVPDVLVPSLLRRRLAGTQFDKRLYHFFKLGSTNELLMRLGQLGEPHGSVAIAEEQTAGRGRAGRSWYSEKASGIYASVLLRPSIPPADAPLLTLLAGLAARDAVAEQTGMEPDLRWPNDLLLRGKKFCGILNELEAEPDRIRFVVIGFGVNVNHGHLPEELGARATSLRIETGRTQSRLELLVRLLRQLDRYYNRFLGEGARPILERFSEVSSYARGKRVRITLAQESFVGTTAGLEPSGLLRVRRDDGRTEVVLAGDVAEVA
jgi:BirA family biotin operon repressor/biotin-[acetyl-CoA-carboxylase] ligase